MKTMTILRATNDQNQEKSDHAFLCLRNDIWKFLALCIALIIVPVKASASPCTHISFGTTPPKNGAISVSGETDCFTFTGAVGDTVRVRVIKTSGTFGPLTDVVRPNGQTCISFVVSEFNCAINSAGIHKILVRDFSPGTRTGKYSLYSEGRNNRNAFRRI